MRKKMILGMGAVCLLMLLGTLFANYLSAEFGQGRVLRRAVEAHGGTEAIRAVKAGRLKGKGVRHGSFSKTADFQWEEAFQLPDRYKLVMRPRDGVTVTYLAPAKTWYVAEGGRPAEPMPGGGQVHPASQLEPLRQLLAVHARKLPTTLLADEEVDYRPVSTVQADSEEWGKVVFCFAKDSGVLLRMRGQLDRAGQDPVKVERIYSQHKTVNGVLLPMKVVMHVNGRLDTEMTITEVEFVDRLEPEVFAKP
jgi:hypothetical protein